MRTGSGRRRAGPRSPGRGATAPVAGAGQLAQRPLPLYDTAVMGAQARTSGPGAAIGGDRRSPAGAGGHYPEPAGTAALSPAAAPAGMPSHGPEPGPGDFAADLADFSEFGAPTRVETVDGVRYFVNEFWTSRQRQAHRIHEVSYRACFKPQLPRFFIQRLTGPNDIVYDPFMGRGTTPVEAALAGRIPYGNDTNPLSRAFTEPRINPPALSDVVARLGAIPWQTFTRARHGELTAFYHPETLAQIEGLRRWLRERRDAGRLDPADRWIRMVALNRLTGHSPGFFSVYTMPPNQAVSLERQRIINRRRNQVPPRRDVPALIARKSRSLLSSAVVPAARDLLFLTGPSHETPQIPSGAVSLTVTSPPFLDVVDYVTDNWLRCWFLGVDPHAVELSQFRRVDHWQRFVRSTLVELARITRPGGHIAFEVGEVRNGTVRLETHVVAAAEGLPLDVLGVMVNHQAFTKTSNCWGVANNRRGTNSNRIVVMRKT